MMKRGLLIGLAVAIYCSSAAAWAAEEPPVDWVDAKTGHRVVRLSREPGSASLYFHQYPYSADGKKLIFTAPSGIWTVDLETHDLDHVVKGLVYVLLTGRKTGDVYFIRWARPEGEEGRTDYRVQGDVRGGRSRRPGRGWRGIG